MLKPSFVLASFIALTLVGCGSSQSTVESKTASNPKSSGSTDVVGKWKVDPDFQKQNEHMKPEGFMTGFASTFWYDLKADNTFEGSMSSGTYKVDGENISIITTKVMDKEVPGGKGVEMKGEFSNGGKTLTLHPPSANLSMLPTELQSGIKMAKE